MSVKLEKKLIVANWKMNGGTQDAIDYLIEYSEKKISECKNADIVICPPFTLLNIFNEKSAENNIFIGGQDCHQAQDGAYTGSVSAKMLKNIGCDYVILGHSERRAGQNETNDLVKQKAQLAHGEGLATIICVGESLNERESHLAEQAVKKQILQSIPDSATLENTVIAYEPVWAIGSGKIPSFDDIENMHSFIKDIIKNEINSFDKSPKILYGGSVKSSNSKEILQTKNVDGLLIGKASLDIEEFSKIIL